MILKYINTKTSNKLTSFQFSSVTQSCPTLCDPMDCSMPGFPVYHKLPEFTQTHVHLIGDAIQPSHCLPSPSPPTFSLSQHQSVSQSVQLLSRVRLFVTPWTAVHQASPSITNSQSLLKLMFIELVMNSLTTLKYNYFKNCCLIAKLCPTLL